MCRRRTPGAWRGSMNSITRLVAIAVGLVLVPTTTPSSGQPVLNPTVSDSFRNTAGGTTALNTCLGKTVAPCSPVENTAFGYGALSDNTSGQDNTAMGINALSSNTPGSQNTAIGAATLGSNTTGRFNTACGALALIVNTTGSLNTASGAEPLTGNNGTANTASGYYALRNNSTGAANVATWR